MRRRRRRYKEKISEKDKKRNKIAKIVLLIILIIVLILLLLKRCGHIEQIDDGGGDDIDNTPYEIKGVFDYNGKTYIQSNDIEIVLTVGTNEDDAEYLLLIVANKKDQTLLPIHISRSVLCDYYDLDSLGKINGTINGNIEKSYGNGSRDLVSLINVRDAVSDLFCNIRIDYCMSMDLNDIADVVDIIGSTSFTAVDNYRDGDITIKAGDTVAVTKSNAYKLIKGDENKETVEIIERRQNRYVDSLFDLGHYGYSLDQYYFVKTMGKISEYVKVSSNEILDLANEVGGYPKLPLVHLAGNSRYNGFVVDEDELIKLCIENIYK